MISVGFRKAVLEGKASCQNGLSEEINDHLAAWSRSIWVPVVIIKSRYWHQLHNIISPRFVEKDFFVLITLMLGWLAITYLRFSRLSQGMRRSNLHPPESSSPSITFSPRKSALPSSSSPQQT